MDNNQPKDKDVKKSEENKAEEAKRHADDPEDGDLRTVF